jgi:hypothetical protein
VHQCPLHTTSVAGSSSLLNCRCVQGFRCAYSKRITAVVTLNTTASDFNSNYGGIKTAFVNAVATAAGVSSSQVTIGSVTPKPSGGGRRLLATKHSFIDVHTIIEGAEKLSGLDRHLGRHSMFLHHSHKWEEAHSLVTHPISSQKKRFLP